MNARKNARKKGLSFIRLVGLVSLISLMLLLNSCNSQPLEETESDLLTDENMIVVGVSQLGAESEWRVANSESIKAALSEENGYRLLFDDARQKQENQILAVRKFIQQQVDYIVIVPLSEIGWDSVLQEAKDAGIPVILADRMIQVDDPSLYATHIGSDFLREGEIAMQWLEENTPPDQPLQILHVQGTPDSSAHMGRSAALLAAVERHENWELLAQLNGDFTRAKAYSIVQNYLAQQTEKPQIDVIYCENDDEAFGAIQALEEAGYVCGEEGITVITFDATRISLEACLAGKICLAVECNPLLGEQVAETIQLIERGGTPVHQQYAEEKYFTKENLTKEFIAARQY